MTTSGGQVNLPVNVGEAFYLIGSGGSYCSDYIGAFLLPPERNGLLCVFATGYLSSKVLFELLFVHVKGDYLTD